MTQLGPADEERRRYRLSYTIEVGPENDNAYLHLSHLLKVTGGIMCAAHRYRLRRVAPLLFFAAFAATGKGIFKMSFIRDGCGPAGRRSSIETAAATISP